MTVTKRKITESIVNQADNKKTAGKIYLPKDWIGKKVKTILLSSLIGMAYSSNHTTASERPNFESFIIICMN
jgi:putative transposon-encoded protein